jgi:membrane fusion protein (multidrug efflux system)
MSKNAANCYVTLFLGCFFLLSCKNSAPQKEAVKTKDAPPAIEGFIIHKESVANQLELTGNLLPFEQTTLMPEIAGRIVQLNLPEGKKVAKGTLLVKLFDGDLQAQLSKLKVQWKNAQATVERQKEFLKINGISQQDYDQSVTQVASLEADIAAIKAQISKTEICAPFSGTIGLRSVSQGAFVTPGTKLAVIRTEDKLKLDFNVPEVQAPAIGNSARVYFRLPGDTLKYPATIIATEKSIDDASLNLKVRALVTAKSKNLIPGTAVNVVVALEARKGTMMIPTQAVIPQARFKSVIVSRNEKAEMVKVKTGVRTDTEVEVLSELKEGDTIVTTGIQFIRPGMKLKFSHVQ